ncbi:FCD domain-containing protein [Streptomyces sp. L7]
MREVLEEGLIHRVSAILTEPELDRLEAVVNRMEEAGRAGRPFPELDREFHEVALRLARKRTRPATPRRFLDGVPSGRRSPRRLDRRPGARTSPSAATRGHRRRRCARRDVEERAARDGGPLPRHRGARRGSPAGWAEPWSRER